MHLIFLIDMSKVTDPIAIFFLNLTYLFIHFVLQIRTIITLPNCGNLAES